MDCLKQLPRDEFIKMFANIVEHNTEVAEALAEVVQQKNLVTISDLLLSLKQILHNLPDNKKREVLSNFPDLAGKLADTQLLTEESTREHQAAGLHQLTPQQKHEICSLNQNYRAKFNFPFIVCARQNKVASILNGLEERVTNSEGVELTKGIEEVVKIASLRAVDIINSLPLKSKY